MSNIRVVGYGLFAIIVALAVNTARGAFELNGLVMQHDYFLNSLDDQVAGNKRPGTLGSGAALVPSGGANNLAYVNLPGTNGNTGGTSHVAFDTFGSDTQNLHTLSENNGGDLTIEIWFDFDPINEVGTGDGQSRFNLFHGFSAGGSDSYLYLDHRQSDSNDHDAGGSKDANIINGTYRGGDAAKTNVEGLHQWVYVMDGNQPSAAGTWTMYMDGQPMAGSQFGGGLSSDLYETSTGANFLTLAGAPSFLTVGGEVNGSGRFGDDPTGKLYRTLIYDNALNASQVLGNFNQGLTSFAPPLPPAKDLTIVTSGHNAPDTEYMNLNNIGHLDARPFNGIATWIAEQNQIRTGVGRLARVPTDTGDIGQTVVHEKMIQPTEYNLALNDMQTMATSPTLNKNYVQILIGNHTRTMDWFDDTWWGQIAHNMGEIAKFTQQGGLEGMLIDPEAYSYQMWGYNQLLNEDPGHYTGKSFAQVEAMVRQRGQEVGAAIELNDPDAKLMFFHAVSFTAQQIFLNGSWSNTEQAPFGLMVPFIDGILDEIADSDIEIIDANSWIKWETDESNFIRNKDLIEIDAKSLSAVPSLFEQKVKVGHTLRTSYDPSEVGPGDMFDPNNPNSNYFTPEILESSVEHALEHSDGYLLFWEGRGNWWFDSPTSLPIGGAPYLATSRFIDPDYYSSIADPAALYAADADFDQNGTVDGRDFLIWQTGNGVVGTGTPATGDANRDTNVDDADLAVWAEQYGSAAVIAAAATSVPEPGCLVLLLIGFTAISSRGLR